MSQVSLEAQPDWDNIKSNATFHIPDTSYHPPYIQPINVGGWEDGLFVTRDGRHLFSTYLPLDAFSWLFDFDPICFDFNPYFRPPLLGIDTVTNNFGCPNFMQSDIIIASRADTSVQFNPWESSNLQTPFSFDGGAHGVLLNADTFDVFVYTKDGVGTQSTDIMFMRNVPVNPLASGAVHILSTSGQEDNPHIERLDDSTLLLFFDRDRYMYYSLSYDNGENWKEPVLVTNVLNDQAPYDVQPHLWNDGKDWWIYFCADNENGVRCIYKSKQAIANDWDSWGARELVIAPENISDGSGTIFGVGEPTLTHWGDISFVVVYGNNTLQDTTDVFDCDPWFLRKKNPLMTALSGSEVKESEFAIFPNPAGETLTLDISNHHNSRVHIEILNSLGVVVKGMEVIVSKQFDVSDLPRGLYFVRLKDSTWKVRKFINR